MSSDLNQEMFKVITYLVSSAPTSLEETPTLAAFRMVDGAHRLMELAEGSDAFGEDEFLRQAHADYLAHYNLVMTDPQAFETWLAEYVRSFTREALRRASQQSHIEGAAAASEHPLGANTQTAKPVDSS